VPYSQEQHELVALQRSGTWEPSVTAGQQLYRSKMGPAGPAMAARAGQQPREHQERPW